MEGLTLGDSGVRPAASASKAERWRGRAHDRRLGVMARQRRPAQNDRNARIGAMIALFRNLETDVPQAVSRTYLSREGRKLERKFLGPVGAAAIKLDADENVLGGLFVGEGIETCLTARQLGLRPAWALDSAGTVGAFPVLAGVACLTLLAEHDDASARAVEACAARWDAAGREVFITRAIGGKDLNDVLKGVV
jgi:putative DNA primase/helicase